MQIKNKKTGFVYYVTKEQWEQMVARFIHRKYEVLDDSDDLTPKVVGVEQVDINDDLANVVKPIDDEDEREHYKELLDELGVSYHPNTGLKKLKILYEEHGSTDNECSDEVL